MLADANQRFNGPEMASARKFDEGAFLSAGMVGFNYVIELVPDKKYGALDPDTGEWNGIVRQILEKVRGFCAVFTFEIVLVFGLIFIFFLF